MKGEIVDSLPDYIDSFESSIELKCVGWEEPNRGNNIEYYSILENGIDCTKKFFQKKEIRCRIKGLATNIESRYSKDYFLYLTTEVF